MSEDKMFHNLNEISEIVVSNPVGGKLSLEKIIDDKGTVNYEEKTYDPHSGGMCLFDARLRFGLCRGHGWHPCRQPRCGVVFP